MKKVLFSLAGLLLLIVTMSFSFSKKKRIIAPEGFSYVPSGMMNLMSTEEDDKITVTGMFMSKGEVTNLEYREFLADLEKSARTEDLEKAKMHPDEWRKMEYSYGEPMVDAYHDHPAFDDYPVVTITKEGAQLYCQWLTEKWAERELTKKEKKQNWGKLEFRLPTKNEWMYAAKGGHDLAPYPWGGYYFRNAKGQILANFRRVGENNIKYDRKTGKYEVLAKTNSMLVNGGTTAPSITYHPNNYGLYNMSGNVSEMLLDGGTKGGSWGSTGYYLDIEAEEEFSDLDGAASFYVGFRPVAVFAD